MDTGRPDIITGDGRMVDLKRSTWRDLPTDEILRRLKSIVFDSIATDFRPVVVTDDEVVARFNTITRGSI